MIFKRIENIRYIVQEKVEKILNVDETKKEFVVSTKNGKIIHRINYIKFYFRITGSLYSEQIFGLIFRNVAYKTMRRI